MGYSGILVSAGTATTNPNPNTLGTVSPYPTPYVNIRTVSTAWTSQASQALFPSGALNGSGQVPIPLMFIPSSATATYEITMWIFDKLSGTWITPADNATFTLTGSEQKVIAGPGYDPIFIQINTISTGTLAIHFDNGLARAQ